VKEDAIGYLRYKCTVVETPGRRDLEVSWKIILRGILGVVKKSRGVHEVVFF
jgi:hypothetical protein